MLSCFSPFSSDSIEYAVTLNWYWQRKREKMCKKKVCSATLINALSIAIWLQRTKTRIPLLLISAFLFTIISFFFPSRYFFLFLSKNYSLFNILELVDGLTCACSCLYVLVSCFFCFVSRCLEQSWFIKFSRYSYWIRLLLLHRTFIFQKFCVLRGF